MAITHSSPGLAMECRQQHVRLERALFLHPSPAAPVLVPDVPGTQVSRSDPFTELDRLNRQLSDYLESWRQLPSLLGGSFTPLTDVEETADAFNVEIELPGVRKDDLDIEVAGRRLTVTGGKATAPRYSRSTMRRAGRSADRRAAEHLGRIVHAEV
ncbi:MAG: Hsp20/alpha crystallin family protein [Acidimicrobiales bacterium]